MLEERASQLLQPPHSVPWTRQSHSRSAPDSRNGHGTESLEDLTARICSVPLRRHSTSVMTSAIELDLTVLISDCGRDRRALYAATTKYVSGGTWRAYPLPN